MRFAWPRLRFPTPAEWAGFVLVMIGLAAIDVAVTLDRWDAWATNIATEAFAVAFAVVVLERVFRREAERRLEPLRRRALETILPEFRTFCECVALDYEHVHARPGGPEVENMLEMLARWVDDADGEVEPRSANAEDGEVPLVRAAVGFAEMLREARAVYGDALPLPLVLELDNFTRNVDMCRRLFRERGMSDEMRSASLVNAVDSAGRFGSAMASTVGDERVFRRYPHAGQLIAYGRTWDAWNRRT